MKSAEPLDRFESCDNYAPQIYTRTPHRAFLLPDADVSRGGIGDNMKKNGYAQKKDAPVFCRLSPPVTEPGRNDAPSVAEDQKQENDHNDPDESVVAEEIAKASHEETSGPDGLIFRSAEAGDSRLHCHGMRLLLPV